MVRRNLWGTAEFLDGVLRNGIDNPTGIRGLTFEGERLGQFRDLETALAIECLAALGSNGWKARYTVEREMPSSRDGAPVYGIGVVFGRRASSLWMAFDPNQGEVKIEFGGGQTIREVSYNRFFKSEHLAGALLARSFANACGPLTRRTG